MSNNIENNWIEAIKQKAEQATREVPEGTWEAISKSLPQQAPKESSTKRGRVAPRMWKAIAAAASVAIVATVGITLLNNNEQQPKEQLAKNVESTQPVPQPQHLANTTTDTTSTNPQAVPATAVPPAATTALPPSTGRQLAKNTPAQPQQKSVAPKPIDLHNNQLAATLPTLSKPKSTTTFKRHRPTTDSHPLPHLDFAAKSRNNHISTKKNSSMPTKMASTLSMSSITTTTSIPMSTSMT